MMIQHVVLFKLQDSIMLDEKEDLIQQIKEKFETLPSKIEQLKALSILVNFNADEEYDFMLIAKLESQKDLEDYAKHPEHLTLVRTLIKPYLDKRAAVDVWIE